jgi:hypothetical protein
MRQIAFVVVLASLLASVRAGAQPQPAQAPPPTPAAPVEPARDAVPNLRGGAPLLYLGTRNVFRSSHIGWTTYVSPDAFDASSGGDTDMIFSIAPRLAFVNTPDHWAWVGTDVSWAVMIARPRKEDKGLPEVAFHDLPLQLGYAFAFVRDDRGLVVQAGPLGSVALPTSPASTAAEVYARTMIGLRGDAAVPMMRGEWLNGLFVSAGGGWRHLFSAVEFPYAGGIGRHRTSDTARTIEATHQTSARSFVRDEAFFSLGYWVNIWGDLSIGNAWGLALWFDDEAALPSFGQPCDVTFIANEPCTTVARTAEEGGPRQATTFDVSLGYAVERLVWVEAGYRNEALAIGADGQRRLVFHSPAAKLYLSATWMVDATWERVRGPRRP